MPTIKIAEPEKICTHPEHDPATLQVFEPGTYDHTCPACGKKQILTVPNVRC